MLTVVLTICGFDTAGAVCATRPVFGVTSEGEEKNSTLPFTGQGFLWPARFERPVPKTAIREIEPRSRKVASWHAPVVCFVAA
jgi:hypothetical protein